MNAKLILEDGSIFYGMPFGRQTSVAGEVVFNTGMVGYPESLTDPSYKGQILILTYPLIGNYGVPTEKPSNNISDVFESDQIHVTGLVVAESSRNFSHWNAHWSLDSWLNVHKVPGLAGVDTRLLTQKLRDRGSMLGKLTYADQSLDFYDPNQDNLVAQVSCEQPKHYGQGKKTILVIDCGSKNNIIRSLLRRQMKVKIVPWNWPAETEDVDGVVISNGPGDPQQCKKTIHTVSKLIANNVPILGICLGSQILALAAGAETYKLKYGHRSQNQPCIRVGSKRCFITSQNHGYAVDEASLPADWVPWFFNANDGSNEGIRHRSKPFIGVQFHPEASPGPVDTQFLFDEFIDML